MKNIKTRDVIFVVIGVAFLIFVGVSMNLSKNAGKKTADDFYVNAKGQKWTLPDTQTYEFTASSGKYPKFLSGVIDPPKVKVGDTQTMTIRVASPSAIKSVKAVIESDTKTTEVPLALIESKALSGNYFREQPYLINDKGELIINRTNSNYAEKVIEQIVATAEAQALVEYTYSGSWVVEDTRTKTYHTKFVVENEKGDKNEMTIAWSDPVCEFSENGVLKNQDPLACRFDINNGTNGLEGFDGGNITIPAEYTVTVDSGGVFVWNGNEGKSIAVNGTILVNTGGKIQEGPLYYVDADGDTYTSDVATLCSPEIGKNCADAKIVRVSQSPSRPWNPDLGTLPNSGIDCMDNDPDVNPGAPFHEASGSNGWDWNCSGALEGGWVDPIEKPGQTASVSANVYRGLNKNDCEISTTFFDAWCGMKTVTSKSCTNETFSACIQSSFDPTKDAVDRGFFDSKGICISPNLMMKGYCR